MNQSVFLHLIHAQLISLRCRSYLNQKTWILEKNKITNKDTLKHHQNFSKYDFSDQEVPTIDELKFYNKILSVHSSHKQIRKIKAEKSVSKFRESMSHQKQCIKLKINEQIQVMNMKIEIIFSQNSYVDQ
ncbi:Hypothetical_protein [Hexamita inflata]|uniref:Hypothetical_protein n=1 Tax=Hexamita inflata TaxID=28002 RepID=A0AA86Q880_9EUKA|nr:Hypothetical protein HINF_LOCUS40768 [Hexamita inflata]